MLNTIFFYLFLWWFAKLENKKLLIARSVLASILFILFLSVAITVFPNMFAETEGFIPALLGMIICIITTILFGLRAIFDIKKILTI